MRHMNKAKLRREGKLPVSIRCDPALIAAGREIVDAGHAWVQHQHEKLDAALKAAQEREEASLQLPKACMVLLDSPSPTVTGAAAAQNQLLNDEDIIVDIGDEE